MSRIHVPIHVRWGDQDALGHVNNATLAQLLEEARIRAFWLHEDPDRRLPSAVFDAEFRIGDEGPFLPLIARNEIEYLVPIAYRQEPLDVRIWFSKLGGASAQIMYEVFDSAGETLYVRAASSMVLVSRETGRPVRLPDAARAAWSPLIDEELRFSRR